MVEIGEEYIFSLIKPLRDLLENAIIKENCPFINVNGKVKSKHFTFFYRR
jgi:hypothetical protein